MIIDFIVICAVSTALLTQNNMLHIPEKNIVIYCVQTLVNHYGK